MEIQSLGGRSGELAIVALKKARQKRIGGFTVADARQPQLLDQPVLQGRMSAFHPPLGWLELAHRISMLRSAKARPNWVMPSPPAASSLLTRKIECLSE